MQNEIGRMQAVMEERLQKFGFLKWSDFVEESDEGEELWSGKEEGERELSDDERSEEQEHMEVTSEKTQEMDVD